MYLLGAEDCCLSETNDWSFNQEFTFSIKWQLSAYTVRLYYQTSVTNGYLTLLGLVPGLMLELTEHTLLHSDGLYALIRLTRVAHISIIFCCNGSPADNNVCSVEPYQVRVGE